MDDTNFIGGPPLVRFLRFSPERNTQSAHATLNSSHLLNLNRQDIQELVFATVDQPAATLDRLLDFVLQHDLAEVLKEDLVSAAFYYPQRASTFLLAFCIKEESVKNRVRDVICDLALDTKKMANLRLQSQGLSPLLSFDGPLSTLTDPEYSSLMPEDLQQTLVKQANHALSDICPKVKLDELRNPKLLIVYKTTGSFITIFENDIDVLWVLFQHMTLSTATDLCERFNCWGANLDELKVLRGQDMLEWMAVTSHWNHGDLQWLSYPAVKPFPKPFLEPDPITSQKWIEAIKSVLLKYPEHVKFTIREGLDPPPSCPGKENTWLFAAQIVIAQWHYMEAEGEWPHHYGRCGMWGKYLTAAQAEHAFSTIRGLLETP